MDAYFTLKPQAPYGVRRLDAALEQLMTYGYYQVPTASDRGGYYMFNAFKPAERSVLMAEATIFRCRSPSSTATSHASCANATRPPVRADIHLRDD